MAMIIRPLTDFISFHRSGSAAAYAPFFSRNSVLTSGIWTAIQAFICSRNLSPPSKVSSTRYTVLPERLAGRGAMARRSMGGGLPVGFKTVYKGCSAAATVPAHAIAMHPSFVSFMTVSPAVEFYSAAHCGASLRLGLRLGHL